MSLVPLSAIDHVFIYGSSDPSTFVMRLPAGLDVGRLVDTFHETARACQGAAGVLVARDRTCYLDLSRHAAEIEEYSVSSERPLRECAWLVPAEIGAPLVRARIIHVGTERAVALSLSLSHAVADAYSTFLFLAAWAARARGEAALPFNCDRTFLTNAAARALPYEIRGQRFENAGFTILEREEPLVRLRWHFEERLRSELAPEDSGLSFNDALCATLWKEDVARRGGRADAKFCFTVDFRRFRPQLGPLFFGNAVLVATISRPAAEVARAPIGEVGQWIRQAVADAPSRIDAAVAELESARATYGLELFKRVRAIYTHAYAVTNLSRIPQDTLNFGTGAPREFHLGVPPQWCPSCAVLPGGDASHMRIAASV